MGAGDHTPDHGDVGTQTELINPNEVAPMAAAAPPKGPRHRQDPARTYHRMIAGCLAVLIAVALAVGVLVHVQRDR
ncbi:MAG: hypothetical protein UHD09_06940 [Bifidobacterium sp.]|nr:hypothetical protein [Bifidobacterium sp.]